MDSEYEQVKKSVRAPWSLIENSPDNFAGMSRMYGVKNVDFKQVMEYQDLPNWNERVYGLIYGAHMDQGFPSNPQEEVDEDARSLFFSNQVVTNVCATSALLGVLLNVQDNSIEIGPELQQFKEFTSELDGVSRGLAIADCDILTRAHATFGSFESRFEAAQYPQRSDLYDEEDEATKKKAQKPTKTRKAAKEEEKDREYHFTAIIPANGYVWELDGYNKSPLKLAPVGDNWLQQIQDFLKNRLDEPDEYYRQTISILAVVGGNNTQDQPMTEATPVADTRRSSRKRRAPANSTSSAGSAEMDANKAQKLQTQAMVLERLDTNTTGFLDAIGYGWRQHVYNVEELSRTINHAVHNWMQQDAGGINLTDHERLIMHCEQIGRITAVAELKRQIHEHLNYINANLNTAGASLQDTNNQRPVAPVNSNAENTDGPIDNHANDELAREIQQREHDYIPAIEEFLQAAYNQNLLRRHRKSN
ncbi:ubiquitin carboxyl-terminal hydrolase [Gongronella butleri]|nr:ubiquitin carboxyl-terminal hydrolase [Gongronella butleri]